MRKSTPTQTLDTKEVSTVSTAAREEAMEKARSRRNGVKAEVSTEAEAPRSTGTIAATLAIYVESQVKADKFPAVAEHFSHVQFNGLNFRGEPMSTQSGNPMAWISFTQKDNRAWKAFNGNGNEVNAMVLVSSKTGLPYVASFDTNRSTGTDSSPIEDASGSKRVQRSESKAFRMVFDRTLERALYGAAWDYLRHICSSKLGITLPEQNSFSRPAPEALDW